jgi:hypothetical protein
MTVTPTADIGLHDCGTMTAEELQELLMRFCQVDSAENARADPEIRVEIKGARHIFQTGTGKLHLYDARDRMAPAHVLTPEAAIAELSRPPPPKAPRPEASGAIPDAVVYVPPPLPRPSRRVPILLVTLALLLGGLAAVWITAPKSESVVATAVADAELTDARRAVIGVYMTSGAPRRHGIAIADDGNVKLFRDNPVAAPSVVRDTCLPAQQGTQRVLLVERLGTVIEVVDNNTLRYGGDTFRRLK